MRRFEERARRERAAMVGLAVMAGVVCLGMLAPAVPARAATNHMIDMNDFFFSPKFITIPAGDTVQWHNAGSVTHTSTSNYSAWAEITLNPGQTSSMVTLLNAGNYSYICSIHYSIYKMWGAIQVTGSTVPEFSSSLIVVGGFLALVVGMMLLGRRGK